MNTRDLEYRHGGTTMLGHFCTSDAATQSPGILMIHGGFGLVPQIIDNA